MLGVNATITDMSTNTTTLWQFYEGVDAMQFGIIKQDLNRHCVVVNLLHSKDTIIEAYCAAPIQDVNLIELLTKGFHTANK